MAKSSIIYTFSLPRAFAPVLDRFAKKANMTRSELMRAALRHYLEYIDTQAMLRTYNTEKSTGSLFELKGSLTDLMNE